MSVGRWCTASTLDKQTHAFVAWVSFGRLLQHPDGRMQDLIYAGVLVDGMSVLEYLIDDLPVPKDVRQETISVCTVRAGICIHLP